MTSEAKQFHCPNCYADLKFSPGQQNFACEYCRSTFTEAEVLAFQRKYEEQEAQYDPYRGQMPPAGQMDDAERRERERFQEETNLYSCPSCGAEIISDANTAAAFCYYCHNPVILKGRVDGMYRPSMVLPFGFDKEMAVDKFTTWAKGKFFAPKNLTSSMQIEKIYCIRSFICENMDSHFTIEELSNKFDMPPTAMKLCFKNVFGLPVFTYARRERMKLAAKQLRECDRGILEIAGEVGYNNGSKFAHAFQDVMGMTPKEYRKKYRMTNVA